MTMNERRQDRAVDEAEDIKPLTGRDAAEALFKEFADGAPEGADAPEETAAPAKPARPASPFLRAIDTLAGVFEREVEAIGASDFIAFKRLQGEKLAAIRNVERLQKNQRALAGGLDREDAERHLRRFNTAVERNMKSLEAVRKATQAVHRYALKALEEKQSDGVYARDGSLKGPDCLSVNGNLIKL